MLAAWEWGQLSGFTTRSQRVWLAVLCGLLLALMLFCCRNITEIFINRWLKSHFGLRWVGGLSRYCWCCFTRVPQQSGVTLKHCALFFGVLTIVPFFWGMLALRARHYDENHYSGAIWLLYVMIWYGALTPAHICLANCLVNISWHRRFLRVKPARLYRWTSDRSGNLMGLWHVGESRRRSRHLTHLLYCRSVSLSARRSDRVCLSVKQELRTAVI